LSYKPLSIPFCSGYFGDRISLFALARQSGPQFSYFKLPTIAGMTGMCHHNQLFPIEMESHKHFCLGLPGTSVILISAPQVAEITVMTYQHPASK
jgi:hypothetical protein